MSHPRDVFIQKIDEVLTFLNQANLCIEKAGNFSLKEASEYILLIQEILENISKLPLEALHKADRDKFFDHLDKMKDICSRIETLNVDGEPEVNMENLVAEIAEETESFWNATSRWGKILSFMYDSP